LSRRLNAVDGAALVVSNVIGVGIFFTPGIVAQLVPNPLAIFGVWLAGGVLASIGASAYSELAARRPRAGGEYVYLREAFGPLAGFLTGWTSFVAGFSGAIAAGAVGMAAYLGRFIPAAVDPKPLFKIPLYVTSLDVPASKIIAILVIFAISGIHICGLGPGRLVQNALAGTKVAALVLLILLGVTLGSGSAKNLSIGGPVLPTNWLLALIPVLFTYSGWNAASYVAEEVRDPARNLPRALALGTGATVAVYLLLNFLYLYAMPAERLAGIIGGGDAVAESLFGPRAAGAVSALMLVALVSSISAMILAGPRVYYAMARDGLFFRSAADVHPRYHSPAKAIIAQAVWSGILVLSGTFQQLLTYTGFAIVLFGGAAVAALFVLRRAKKSEDLPFRTWGYPVAPAIFVMVSLAVVLNGFWLSPGPSAAGLLIIAAGVPLYLWARRGRAAARS